MRSVLCKRLFCFRSSKMRIRIRRRRKCLEYKFGNWRSSWLRKRRYYRRVLRWRRKFRG